MIPEIEDGQRMNPLHYAAVRSDGLSFMACLEATLDTPELIQQHDRLYGTTFFTRRQPIEVMVDKACGKQEHDIQALLRFVWNCVFIRVPNINGDKPRDMKDDEIWPIPQPKLLAHIEQAKTWTCKVEYNEMLRMHKKLYPDIPIQHEPIEDQ